MEYSLKHMQVVPFLAQEVRTSLTAVLGFIEALYDSRLTVQERFTNISKARHTIENTSKLLEDITHIATESNGTLSIKGERFALDQCISRVVTVMKALARKSELGFDIKPEGPLPEFVISDSVRLEECLISITHLLIEKCDRGTLQLSLQLSEKNASDVDFVIDSTSSWKPRHTLDNGTLGDSLDNLRIQGLPLIHGKAAISLALAQALAGALGGTLTMEPSALGKGVRFRVSIPLGPFETLCRFGPECFDASTKSSDVKPITLRQFNGERFLIVEDDEDILNLISTFLEKSGATVDRARNGKECLERCEIQRYSCIIMDLHLPFFNGVSCLYSIRNQGLQTPVIAMTANTSSAARKSAIGAGATRFLTKPIRIETLFKTLELAMQDDETSNVASRLQV